MTKKKDPSEWKQKPKPELIGGETKVCPACGATINRDGMTNFAWIRKQFCSRACHYARINENSWKRRRACQ